MNHIIINIIMNDDTKIDFRCLVVSTLFIMTIGYFKRTMRSIGSRWHDDIGTIIGVEHS